MSGGLSAARVLHRELRSNWAPQLTLAVVVLLTTFCAVAASRALPAEYDDALAHAVAGAPPAQRDLHLVSSPRYSGPPPGPEVYGEAVGNVRRELGPAS